MFTHVQAHTYTHMYIRVQTFTLEIGENDQILIPSERDPTFKCTHVYTHVHIHTDSYFGNRRKRPNFDAERETNDRSWEKGYA